MRPKFDHLYPFLSYEQLIHSKLHSKGSLSIKFNENRLCRFVNIYLRFFISYFWFLDFWETLKIYLNTYLVLHTNFCISPIHFWKVWITRSFTHVHAQISFQKPIFSTQEISDNVSHVKTQLWNSWPNTILSLPMTVDQWK